MRSLDGRPLPAARVELLPGPPAEWDLPFDVPSLDALPTGPSAATSAGGAAVLAAVPEGRWYVAATAPGFARRVVAGIHRRGDEAVETDVALAPGHGFTGTVRGEDGAPAAGVLVVLQPGAGSVGWLGDAHCLRTRSGTDGTYRFDSVEAGPYTVWYEARTGLFVPDERVLVPSLDGLDLRRVRGATIEGTVRDAETGDALAGARVFAVRFDWSGSSSDEGKKVVLDVRSTDADGRFALHTWRAETKLTRLVVDAPGYVALPVDHGSKELPGPLRDGQRLSFGVRVRRGVTLTGTLSGPDGPLEGMDVRVQSDEVPDWPSEDRGSIRLRQVRSSSAVGADGRWRIDGLPAGEVRISICDAATGDYVQGSDFVVPDQRETVHDITVPIGRGRIRRRIVDPDGEPVPNVEVTQRLGTFSSRAVTDAEGWFDLPVLFGPEINWLRFRRSGWRELTDLVGNEIGEHEEPLPDGFHSFAPVRDLTGSVVRGDGTPLAGVRVLLDAGLAGVCSSLPRWTGRRETVTAADGSFRVALTSGHDWWLRVPGAAVTWTESDEEGGTPLRATIEPPVRVAGQAVAAEDGRPMRGALLRNGDDVVVGRTSADGRFATEIPATAAYGLKLTGAGRVPAPIAGDVPAPRIALRATRSIAGTVLRPDRSAAAGLLVTARRVDAPAPREEPAAEDEDVREDDPAGESVTDAAGRFVLPALEPGEFEVELSDPVSYAQTAAPVRAPAGSENLAIEVVPAVRLDFEIVLPKDDHGPSRRTRITAVPASSGVPAETKLSDYYGGGSIALRPGVEYTIRAEHPRFPAVELPGIRGGGEKPLRIELTTPR